MVDDARKARTEHRLRLGCGRIPGGNEQRQRQPDGGARGTEKMEPDLGEPDTMRPDKAKAGFMERARRHCQARRRKGRNGALRSKARAESEAGDLAGRKAHAWRHSPGKSERGDKAKSP